MKWERIDDTQITIIEGDYKEGFCIEVLSLGGRLLSGPRPISHRVAKRCVTDYGFVPIDTQEPEPVVPSIIMRTVAERYGLRIEG